MLRRGRRGWGEGGPPLRKRCQLLSKSVNQSISQSISQSVSQSVSMTSYLLQPKSRSVFCTLQFARSGAARRVARAGRRTRRHAAQGANEDERIAPLQQLVVQREVHGLRAQRGGDHRSGQLCAHRQRDTAGCARAGQGRGGGEAGALHRDGRRGLSGGRRPARAADLHRRRQEVHPRPARP